MYLKGAKPQDTSLCHFAIFRVMSVDPRFTAEERLGVPVGCKLVATVKGSGLLYLPRPLFIIPPIPPFTRLCCPYEFLLDYVPLGRMNDKVPCVRR
jgi:hypothetical protein